MPRNIIWWCKKKRELEYLKKNAMIGGRRRKGRQKINLQSDFSKKEWQIHWTQWNIHKCRKKWLSQLLDNNIALFTATYKVYSSLKPYIDVKHNSPEKLKCYMGASNTSIALYRPLLWRSAITLLHKTTNPGCSAVDIVIKTLKMSVSRNTCSIKKLL